MKMAVLMVWVLALPWTAEAKNGRMRVIDFEDEVVEGLNQRPLGSLNYVSEKNGRRKNRHLYRKRVGFSSEIRETLKEMRYR